MLLIISCLPTSIRQSTSSSYSPFVRLSPGMACPSSSYISTENNNMSPSWSQPWRLLDLQPWSWLWQPTFSYPDNYSLFLFCTLLRFVETGYFPSTLPLNSSPRLPCFAPCHLTIPDHCEGIMSVPLAPILFYVFRMLRMAGVICDFFSCSVSFWMSPSKPFI